MLGSLRRPVGSLLILFVGGLGLLFASPAPSRAQQVLQFRNLETGEQMRRTYPEGTEVVFPFTSDSSPEGFLRKAAVFNPQDTARIIVEFDRTPVVRKRVQLGRRGVPEKTLGSRLQTYRSRLENLHERFRRDLREIARGQEEQNTSKKIRFDGQGDILNREYTEVFSGAAVITRQWAVEQIRDLPYVETTYPDRRVEAIVGDAREVVDASELQAEAGASGEDVVVGIIDTGVDYNHPALGGGFGPGHKVVGGHDFVNDDSDPMDDNGHGTHVAGIAAADGQNITGVAPRAKLRAYKVLNSNGRGYSSDVIAAIERAVADEVDIINMSLGGGGTPGDPTSQATDNASRAGVLPVVSAGNAGPEYQTISSPGTARRALTVGASKGNDQVADFSSRGPTDGAFTVKPDVVAPGVGIRSTLRGNSFGELSGTSMASPVTAGVAALLLDLHPGWSPTFTKGAIMETGVDLGEDIWTQGHGRVDADSAAGVRVVATPAILSFGRVDNEVDTWTHTDTLKLRNRGSSSRTYHLSTSSSPAPGVSIDLSTTSVTVPGGDSAFVPVTAEVDNATAPFPEGPPPAFTGNVTAIASQDTVSVPYAIVKAPTITLAFASGVENAFFLTHQSDGQVTLSKQWIQNVPSRKTIVLPEVGRYDFVTRLAGSSIPDTYLIREDVSVTEVESITLGPEEAEHEVIPGFVDEKGNPILGDKNLAVKAGSFALGHQSGVGFSSFSPLKKPTRFSSISDEYTIRGINTYHKNGESKDYHIQYRISSVSQNIKLRNNPDNLRKTTYRVGKNVAKSADARNWVKQVIRLPKANFIIGFLNGLISDSDHRNIDTPVKRELYKSPEPPKGDIALPEQFSNYLFVDPEAQEEPSFSNDLLLYESGVPQISGPDTTVFFRPIDFKAGTRRAADKTIDIGGHPPRWEADITESSSESVTDLGYFELPFAGIMIDTFSVELYRDGRLIERGSIRNDKFSNLSNRSKVPPSDGGLEVGDSLVAQFNTPVVGRIGQTELRFVKGTGELGPRFDTFEVLAGSQVSDTLSDTNENVLQVSLESKSTVDSTIAYLSPTGQTQWRRLAVGEGGTLRTEIPSTLSRGHYAVRLVAKGKEGGRVEQVADPAFWFGHRREGPPDPPATPAIVNFFNEASIKWSSPFASDVESYRVYRKTTPIDSSAGPSAFTAISTLEAGINRYADDDVEAGQTYHYRITAVDSSGLESGFSREVVTTVKAPALTLEGHQIDFTFPGNDDGQVQAGEFLRVALSFTNATDSTLGSETYARMDSSADRYVHPISAYRFTKEVEAFQELPAGEATKFGQGFGFHVAGNAPEGHVLEIPMEIRSGNDHPIGRDTLRMEVRGPDTTPPKIRGWDVNVDPGYVEPGNSTMISAFVTEGYRQMSAEATVTRRSDGQQVGTVSFTDNGSGADQEAGDRVFTGTFTPQQESEYVVDISATDKPGNTGRFEGASFTSEPFPESGEVIVVADNGRPWRDEIESDYVSALEGAGVTPQVWSVYLRGEPPVERLQMFDAAVWYSEYGIQGRDEIETYLDEGGRLLISGNSIAAGLRYSDSTWTREVLKARYIQRAVDRYEVEGVDGDPVSDGFTAELTRRAFGADEIDPVNGGVQMLTYDESATEPQSGAKATRVSRTERRRLGNFCSWRADRKVPRRPACKPGEKVARVNRASEHAISNSAPVPKDIESSGTAGIRYSEGSQRLVYLTFGLETLRSAEKRVRLTERVMKWFENSPVASATMYVDRGRKTDFGDTGVALMFHGVSAPDSVTVKKYHEAPSGREGISERIVSDFRYVVDPGGELRFDSSKVQFAVSSLSGINDPSNVRIYHRDEPGTGRFSALETAVDKNGTSADISDDTLSTWTSSFSEFVLASNTEPLPVELAVFDATVQEGTVRLTWRTASETQNAGFAVQRRSEPQEEWKKIGFVESKAQGGSTSGSVSYQFFDRDPPYAADSLSYRLRQVDTDGSKRLSGEITVRRAVGEVQLLETYPNPAHRRATLRYAVPDRQDVTIHLYDVLGRRVKTVVDGEREGRQETQLDVSRLASGVYFVRLRAGGKILTQRVTVVR